MAEYIERESALKIVTDMMCDCKVTHKGRAIRRNIKQIPAADVVEVKHGEWTEKQIPLDWCDDDVDIVYECSICKAEEPYTSTYCPNCGAKMDWKGGAKE